jgi:hypothetical protein
VNKAGRVRREKTYQTSRNNFLFSFSFPRTRRCPYCISWERRRDAPPRRQLFVLKEIFFLAFILFFFIFEHFDDPVELVEKREPTRPGYYMVERARKKKGKRESSFEFYTLA